MGTTFKSPSEILAAYESGLKGWIDDPASRQSLLTDGIVQRGTAAPLLSGKKQRALLWRYRRRYDKTAYEDEPQDIGDCTSHGVRNAIDTTRSIEIAVGREPEEYGLRTACEIFYGARGHGGEGSDPGRLTRFATGVGYLGRKNYPGVIDLSKYNSKLGQKAGAKGWPEPVLALCREHKAGKWLAPRTVEESRDLLFNGYGAHSGQSLGFKSVPDSRGIFVPIKSGPQAWSHDMAIVGFDFTRDFYPIDVFFFAQSWAAWCTPPKKWPTDLYGPYIKGMIVFDADLMESVILRAESIYHFSDIQGYVSRELPDLGWTALG